MKHSLTLLAVLGSPAWSQASFLINGGFELPGTGAWNHYHNGEVPAWTVGQNDLLEIGVGVVYGVTGFEGRDMLELDSTRNVAVSQSVALAQGAYDLSFLFARRTTDLQGRSSDTCKFDVLWNGQVLRSYDPTSGAMEREHLLVQAIAGKNTVTFRGMGASDSYGAIIDDARLETVPEPSLVLACAAGLSALMRRRPQAK